MIKTGSTPVVVNLRHKISIIDISTDADGHFWICPTDNEIGWNILQHSWSSVNPDLVSVVHVGYPAASVNNKNEAFNILSTYSSKTFDDIWTCKESRIYGAYQMKALVEGPPPAYGSVPLVSGTGKVLVVEWYD